MYTTLSLDRLIKLMMWPFAFVICGMLLWQGLPASGTEWLRLASSSIAVFAIVVLLIGGSSSRYAPWRLVWRIFPFLNDSMFPDLNGTWTGNTCSNWPLVDAQRKAAMAGGGLTQADIEQIALQEDGITLQIRASLFKLQISAELQRTGAKSYSLSQRVIRDERRDIFELSYVYRQETPEPVITDESAHLGAAALDFDPKQMRLRGYYWTTRIWRQGLNTAGRLDVHRVDS